MCKNSEIERNDEQPLLERLEAYGRTDVYPFHMPGHKRRLGPKEMGHLYEMDITEIDGFDNLHEPEGILKDAQLRRSCIIRKRQRLLSMAAQRGFLQRLPEYAGMAEKSLQQGTVIRRYITPLSCII